MALDGSSPGTDAARAPCCHHISRLPLALTGIASGGSQRAAHMVQRPLGHAGVGGVLSFMTLLRPWNRESFVLGRGVRG